MYEYVPYLKSSFLSDIDTPALRNFAISHECLNAAMGFGFGAYLFCQKAKAKKIHVRHQLWRFHRRWIRYKGIATMSLRNIFAKHKKSTQLYRKDATAEFTRLQEQ